MKYSYKLATLWSCTCLACFLLGIAFAARSSQIQIQKETQTPVYIDVTTTKKNISIQQIPTHVFIRVNGQVIQSGSIDLKE